MDIKYIKSGYCNFCDEEKALINKEVLEFRRDGQTGLQATICAECLAKLNASGKKLEGASMKIYWNDKKKPSDVPPLTGKQFIGCILVELSRLNLHGISFTEITTIQHSVENVLKEKFNTTLEFSDEILQQVVQEYSEVLDISTNTNMCLSADTTCLKITNMRLLTSGLSELVSEIPVNVFYTVESIIYHRSLSLGYSSTQETCDYMLKNLSDDNRETVADRRRELAKIASRCVYRLESYDECAHFYACNKNGNGYGRFADECKVTMDCKNLMTNLKEKQQNE